MITEEIDMTFPRYESPVAGYGLVSAGVRVEWPPMGGLEPHEGAAEGAEFSKDSYIEAEPSRSCLDASDLMWFIDGVPWFVWLMGCSFDPAGEGYFEQEWDPIGDSVSTYLGMGECDDARHRVPDGYLEGRVDFRDGAMLIFPEPIDLREPSLKRDCDNIGCVPARIPTIGWEF